MRWESWSKVSFLVKLLIEADVSSFCGYTSLVKVSLSLLVGRNIVYLLSLYRLL